MFHFWLSHTQSITGNFCISLTFSTEIIHLYQLKSLNWRQLRQHQISWLRSLKNWMNTSRKFAFCFLLFFIVWKLLRWCCVFLTLPSFGKLTSSTFFAILVLSTTAVMLLSRLMSLFFTSNYDFAWAMILHCEINYYRKINSRKFSSLFCHLKNLILCFRGDHLRLLGHWDGQIVSWYHPWAQLLRGSFLSNWLIVTCNFCDIMFTNYLFLPSNVLRFALLLCFRMCFCETVVDTARRVRSLQRFHNQLFL